MLWDQCDVGFGNKITWNLRVMQAAECINSSEKLPQTFLFSKFKNTPQFCLWLDIILKLRLILILDLAIMFYNLFMS